MVYSSMAVSNEKKNINRGSGFSIWKTLYIQIKRSLWVIKWMAYADQKGDGGLEEKIFQITIVWIFLKSRPRENFYRSIWYYCNLIQNILEYLFSFWYFAHQDHILLCMVSNCGYLNRRFSFEIFYIFPISFQADKQQLSMQLCFVVDTYCRYKSLPLSLSFSLFLICCKCRKKCLNVFCLNVFI